MKIRSTILVLTSLFLAIGASKAQHLGKDLKTFCVGFYNVENLFDTINQPKVIDEEFTPQGLNKWDTEKYEKKLKHISEVIKQLGGNHIGPDIIGLAEVENKDVLEDLVNTPALKDKGYGIIHYDSPDARGIDCALLYKQSRFHVAKSSIHPVKTPDNPNHKTRDILLVEGEHDGDFFYFLVAHWPSRYGGEKISMPRRMEAAQTMRSISDSIVEVNPKAKIIMMGDFNDDPISPSLTKGLGVVFSTKSLNKASDLYTPMYDLYKDGYGTLAYRDAWNLFDIMVLNRNVIKSGSGYKVYREPRKGYRAFIMNKSFLTQTYGRFKGYPKRTLAGGTYQGGYSDHFPVYLYLVKKAK